MRQRVFIPVALLFAWNAANADDRRPMTAQAERGQQLFLKSPKGTACVTCHSMAGIGTAVGPDLSKLVAVVGPRGIVSAIRMTVTEYVQEVQISGETFPGIQRQKQGDEIEMWDLSKQPPELRKLTAKQIVSLKPNQKWRRPPASAGYTSEELTGLIGFLKWAATGSQKEVAASEVEE